MRVLMLAAITVDGKIARAADEFSGWTSREDKRLFARTSREAGVVIMGRNTFATMPGPLPGRLNVVLSRLVPATPQENVEWSAESPAQVLANLAARGYSTVVLGGGARTYRQFLDADLIDELWLTIEPLAFGAGVALFGDTPLNLRLTLLETRPLGDQAIHLRYTVQRKPR